MKKLIALLTAFILMTSVFQFSGVAFAEEKTTITLKQAIEIAKSSLGIDTEGFEFNSSYNEDQNGYNMWTLNWSKSKANNEYIYVSVDADSGEITNVSWWSSYEQPQSKIPKHTKAEALKVAQDLAAKLQGDKFKETRLEEANDDYYSKYADTYLFTFRRVYDGIDVISDHINVQIDKNTLKLRSFDVSWTKGSLPSKSEAFSILKARQLFKQKLGLELTYNLAYGNQNDEPKVILAYTLKNGNMPLDAVTGEPLNSFIIRPFEAAKDEMAVSFTEAVAITPEEQSELDKSSKYITKAEAEQAARQYITIDSKLKLERANLYPGYHKQNASWNLEWIYSDTENSTYKSLSVQIDAVTKEILNFNVYDSTYYQSKQEDTIDKDKAKKLAEEFLKKIQPEKFAKTQYKEYKDQYGYAPINDYNYSFNFVRVENGVPCPSNSLFVGVNKATGEIVSFNTSWLDLDFPSPDKAISLDKAYSILFSKVKYELQYIQHYKNINDYQSRELKLAYVLENMPILIDGNNGIMLDYNGKPITPVQKHKYTDIQGNKAENEINLLIEMGIIVPDSDKFMPDSKILQKDFVMLLMNSLQPEYYILPVAKAEDRYDDYYNEAIRRKIITEADKAPEAYVTRQDAAKMIIRAMGYGVIAEKSNMFAVSFKDASKLTAAYKGYAVMASEFGIIPAIESNFDPTTQITKGDTAEFIVNYLKCDTSL